MFYFDPREIDLISQIPSRHIHIQDGNKPRVQSSRDYFWEQRSPVYALLQVKQTKFLWSLHIPTLPLNMCRLFQPNDCSDQQLYSRPTLTESRSQSTVFTFNAYFQFVPTITVLLRGINVFRCTPNIFLILTTFTPMHVELAFNALWP